MVPRQRKSARVFAFDVEVKAAAPLPVGGPAPSPAPEAAPVPAEPAFSEETKGENDSPSALSPLLLLALVISAVVVAAAAGAVVMMEKGGSASTTSPINKPSSTGFKDSASTNSHEKETDEHKECHWSYAHGGASQWASMECIADNQCGGRHQSPVALTTPATASPPLLILPTSLGNTTKYTVTDSGHAVVINIDDKDYQWTVADNEKDPPTKYKLVQFHFHLGRNDQKGSEHTVDEETYPLEAHLVHINEQYETLQTAIKHPGGVAVLAALFATGNESEPEDALEPLVKKMTTPTAEGTELDLKKFFGGLENPDYLSYSGSLTTPPCTEGVKWFVFKQKATVKKETLAEFRSHIKSHSKNNYRPPQPLNERTVKHFGTS